MFDKVRIRGMIIDYLDHSLGAFVSLIVMIFPEKWFGTSSKFIGIDLKNL